jgi:GntR family transcriptional repressor for pyruvate dehydrogenase complex
VHAPDGVQAAQLTAQLRQLSLHELRDIGDHRAAVAGAAARLAAQRALTGEVATLREHVGRLRSAGTLTERRRADARIHIEIAAVAQSPRLTRQEMNLWSEVGDLVWLPVTGGQVAGVTGEHDALVEAIGQQDDERARRLAEQHVFEETARLLDLRLALG